MAGLAFRGLTSCNMLRCVLPSSFPPILHPRYRSLAKQGRLTRSIADASRITYLHLSSWRMRRRFCLQPQAQHLDFKRPYPCPFDGNINATRSAEITPYNLKVHKIRQCFSPGRAPYTIGRLAPPVKKVVGPEMKILKIQRQTIVQRLEKHHQRSVWNT